MVTPDKVWKAGSRTSRGRMNRDEGALRDEKGRAVGKKSLARPASALDVVRPRIKAIVDDLPLAKRAEVPPPKLLSDISHLSGSLSGGPPSRTSEN